MPAWPAELVEKRAVDKLILYARNARVHSDAQIAQIAASIIEFGWTIPVLIDEKDVVIAGHGRVLAARQLGITDIPTMVAHGWTAAQIKAYRIADNQLASNAAWNYEFLQLEFADLDDMSFDLALTGFNEIQRDQIFAIDHDVTEEWQDMPEFQNDRLAFKTLKVHFKNADDLAVFSHVIGQEINENTKYIWYPKAPKQVLRNTQYITDDAAE